MKESFHVEYDVFEAPEELASDEQELLEAAVEAMEGSYAIYYDFNVGAAVRTSTGMIVTGSNQETANGKGSCAEHVALNKAGTEGFRWNGGIRKIAIIGRPTGGESTEPVTPCGACRQDIKEWESMWEEKIVIICAATNGKIRRFVGIDSLLPFGFGPRDLGIDLAAFMRDRA